jgi:glycosyltransferase involved in cell wall biosynthesis
MKISIIGCPFQTTYGAYISSLRSALERNIGAPVQWVGSNCGCGDPNPGSRQFQAGDCHYFEMRHELAGYSLTAYSPDRVKQFLRSSVRAASNTNRAKRYLELSAGADIMHLQQILAAYGSDVVFRFLRQPSAAARVITVHELDAEQTDHPENNQTYNLADALIVHDSAMKKKLVSLGVAGRLVHVVRQGTDLVEGKSVARDGIVYYGGHHFNEGKGIGVLLDAYRRLKNRYAGSAPRLRIHGHYGTPPKAFLDKASELGVADGVEWLNDVPMNEIAPLYRRSQVCVLPYKGSFAGFPVGVAAANRVPIIATRAAGIPDHIGDLGIYVGGDDPDELADRIDEVLRDEVLRQDYGARLRAHAESRLSWDAVARDTLAVYQAALEERAAKPSVEPHVAPLASDARKAS